MVELWQDTSILFAKNATFIRRIHLAKRVHTLLWCGHMRI